MSGRAAGRACPGDIFYQPISSFLNFLKIPKNISLLTSLSNLSTCASGNGSVITSSNSYNAIFSFFDNRIIFDF